MENSPQPDSQPPQPRRTKLPERRSRPVEPQAVRPREVRAGLEQRGPLPPPPPPLDDDRSLWRALRPFVAFVVVGGAMFFLLRYFMRGIEDAAVEARRTEAVLTAIATDFWRDGRAPEIVLTDFRLRIVLDRLKEKLGRTVPSVLVVPEDIAVSGLTPTHGFVYSVGTTQVLVVNVRMEGPGDPLTVLSFTVGPAFADVLEGLPEPEPGVSPDADGLPALPGLPEKVSEEP